ncbi:MAG TPA: trehalose-phosphatase [Oculatellaceae cyanobacterium]
MSGEGLIVENILHIIKEQYVERDVFIGLDRDGTIVPYAERPEDAKVDQDLSSLLDALVKKPGLRVGIISARSIAQLRSDFDSKKLFLAGNYGMEISSPQGDVFIQPFALDAVPALKDLRDRMASAITDLAGVILEDHGYSLCLHYHRVASELLPRLHELMANLKQRFNALLFTQLTTSYEVKPLTPWSKGEALDQIFKTYQKTLKDSFVFYAGDSPPDEPAYSWANARGGVSLKVGDGVFETCSQFQIGDVGTARSLLRELSKLER